MRYLTVILMSALFTLAGCGGDKSGEQAQAPVAPATMESDDSEEMSVVETISVETTPDDTASDKPQWVILEQNVIYYDE